VGVNVVGVSLAQDLPVYRAGRMCLRHQNIAGCQVHSAPATGTDQVAWSAGTVGSSPSPAGACVDSSRSRI